ncbi:MAG TPA: metallophosphoesterase family protein [Polyangiaceae bacterium]|nr:metallophosphoesterase family protein [Polyangiaceae bacterium]
MIERATEQMFSTSVEQGRRLGIISCIHGNLEALESVLTDLRRRAVDHLLCLGDLVGYGPFPDEVTARIRALGIPALLGCWDEGIAEENENCGCTFVSQEEGQLGEMAFLWTTLHVSEDTKSYLGTLPMTAAFDLPCGRLVAVHGSPASTSEYLMESTHELVLFERAASAGCDILVCGHTHVPYVKQVAGTLEVRAETTVKDRIYRARFGAPEAARPVTLAPKTIVNAGSVGEPRHGGRAATYAIVDTHSGDVELCEVEYDVEKTVHAMRAREVPAKFAERLLRGEELTGKRKEVFCVC